MSPSPEPSAAAETAAAHRLARLYAALVTLVTGLIVLGAMVRAFEAGLACPDWPLCFGEVIPEMNLEVAFEFTHRVVAGGVAVIYGLLAWRTWPLAWARGHVLLAGALLLVQIVLGGLTVLQLLAEWTVTSHLIVGNSVNAALLWLALRLHDRERPVARRSVSRIGGLALAAVCILGIGQMVLGGLVASSYAGLACPEWPTCNGGAWVPTWSGTVGLHLLHRFNGYALAVALLAGAVLLRGRDRLGVLAVGAAVIAALQICVGIANVLLGLPEMVTALHSGLAAALVLTLTAAVREWMASPERADEGEFA